MVKKNNRSSSSRGGSKFKPSKPKQSKTAAPTESSVATQAGGGKKIKKTLKIQKNKKILIFY